MLGVEDEWMMKDNLKNYKVRIELNTEWSGTSVEDIREQIDEEWGGFGDIQNDIDIEEINQEKSGSSG